jgi:hypothetical protein
MSEDPKPIDLYKEIIEMRELIEANREMLSKSPPVPANKGGRVGTLIIVDEPWTDPPKQPPTETQLRWISESLGIPRRVFMGNYKPDGTAR